MKVKKVLVLALWGLAILLAACSPHTTNTGTSGAGEPKTPLSQGSGAEKEKREFLYVNGIELKDGILREQNFEIHYPEIHGLLNENIQNKINGEIKNSAAAFAGELSARYREAVESGQARVNRQVHAGYWPAGNYSNVLSIQEHYYVPLDRSAERWLKGYNYRIDTGEKIELKDVFREGTDYKSLINKNISEQILRQNLDETSLRRPFGGIGDSQEFYITESHLVICFNPDNPWFSPPPRDGREEFMEPFGDMGAFEFRIPFSKLGGAADIYEKYENTSGRLYSQEKRQKKWLPNDLEIIDKKVGARQGGYVMEARYVEIKGADGDPFLAELNRAMAERAGQFVADQDVIKRSAAGGGKGEPIYKVRQTRVTANFAGKLCIVEEDHLFEPRGGGSYTRSAYCYDIKKGRLITLKDLFGSHPELKATVPEKTRIRLAEAGLDPGPAVDFDTLAKNAGFFFDENMLYIIFRKEVMPRDQGLLVDINVSELGGDIANIF